MAAGCASTRSDSFASRFIVSGKPTLDIDWRVPDARPVPRAPAKIPAGTPTAPRAATLGTTLEATMPELQARLDALALSRSAAAYLAAAAAYQSLGVDDRAFDLLTAGVAEHPRHGGLHEAVARQWRVWGMPERGLRDAHLAVRYAPGSASAQTTLGTILWDLGRYRDAVACFAGAADRAPEAPYARHNYCAALRATGQATPADCPATPVLPERVRSQP